MYYRELTQPHSVHLMDHELIKTAPSIFAERPYHEVSNRYGFVPTIQVINALRTEGWYPVDATQKNVRIKAKTEFTKHLIRFRRLDNDIIVNDSAVELVLTNSHDRSAAFVLHAGIFRIVCANGIVTADSTFQKISIRHSQNATGHVVEGAYSVVETVPLITNEIEAMSNIDLSEPERHILANAALDYVLPDLKDNEEMLTSRNELVKQVLRPKRAEDTGKDLWSTFNVIQEKCLRGGLRLQKFNQDRMIKRTTTREVKSIDKNIKLNKALWSMAEQMKDLKQ